MKSEARGERRPTGIVLAGGASRRMGTDKAALELGGRTLLQHAVDALERADVGSIVVVGAADRSAPTVRATVRAAVHSIGPVRFEVDAVPGEGPLRGLAAGLAAAAAPVALVVGVDMPFVEPELLRLLAARAAGGASPLLPLHEGVPQPLCSAWPSETLPRIEALLAAGERSILTAARALDAEFVPPADYAQIDPEGRSFWSIDTPEALAAARAQAES